MSEVNERSVLDVIKLTTRLQMAKTNIDYAARVHDELAKKESILLQEEVNKLLETSLEDPEKTFNDITDFLESNEAQISSLNESAIFVSLEKTAGQN